MDPLFSLLVIPNECEGSWGALNFKMLTPHKNHKNPLISGGYPFKSLNHSPFFSKIGIAESAHFWVVDY